jgi:K+-sensing histidine kinase KdpD
MIIKNANNWSSHSSFEALIWAFCSFAIISAWMHVMGSNFYGAHPYKFYFFAATVLAYFFGYITASIYILVSSIYANLYFVPPFGVFTLTPQEAERFLINLLFGAVAIFFIEILQRERYKTKLLLLVSESRYLTLLHRDNQLLQELKRKNNVKHP